MLRDQLLARGIAEASVECIPGEVDAVQSALQLGHEGDLIVIFGDDIERCWGQIVGHKVEAGGKTPPELLKPAPSFVEADPDAFRLDPAAELVRDGRGVRIARVEEESD
jgi:cyanophycin synthetase